MRDESGEAFNKAPCATTKTKPRKQGKSGPAAAGARRRPPALEDAGDSMRSVAESNALDNLRALLELQMRHYRVRAVDELADADPYLAGHLAGNLNALATVQSWVRVCGVCERTRVASHPCLCEPT